MGKRGFQDMVATVVKGLHGLTRQPVIEVQFMVP